MVARVMLPDPPEFRFRGNETPEETAERWGRELTDYVQGVHEVFQQMVMSDGDGGVALDGSGRGEE